MAEVRPVTALVSGMWGLAGSGQALLFEGVVSFPFLGCFAYWAYLELKDKLARSSEAISKYRLRSKWQPMKALQGFQPFHHMYVYLLLKLE